MASPKETLVLPLGRALSWNEFDADWYRRTYWRDSDVADALQHYLSVGQAAGHAPNMFFDEVWYLRRNRDVAEAIRAGYFSSGFDHYCRVGQTSRTPHWLFDLEFYQAESPDLTAESLALGGFVNLYDHFLRVGNAEGRVAHPLFDANYYKSQYAADGINPESEDLPPFVDFLSRLHNQHDNLPATSIYFDAKWYSAVYHEAIDTFRVPLHHYLCNNTPDRFDPLPHFSERFYLESQPDVATAVTNGAFTRGYMHFLRAGVFELRNPAPHINMRYYWEHHVSARRAVQSGGTRDAFAHLITVGARHGLTFAPYQTAQDIPEDRTRTLFAAQAQSLLPLYARRPIDFTLAGSPTCSVIIALNNGFALSMQAIASVRQNHHGNIELILVDSGSVDETGMIERYVTGAHIVRLDTNVGFSKACNAGLQRATAGHVLFLNSDVRLDCGAIAAALARIESDPRIGAVGGKVIRTNETLQEAGCIIWRNGWTTGYLRDESPLRPEACFVRDVDFCSAVFLMARADLLRQLGGFDTAFSPAYFEDADLGIRIWQAGYRFVYDPTVVLHHYEHGSATDVRSAQVMLRARHQMFFDKHLPTLRIRHAPSPTAVILARSADAHRRRVLFIEDTVPLPHLGSGYVRANDIIRVMASLDYHVTVFPMQPCATDIAVVHAAFPDTVEVIHDRSLKDLAAFLRERRSYYDCIWISRSHNLDQVRPILEEVALPSDRTRIVLDTEALAAPRSALRTAILGQTQKVDPNQALRHEMRNAFFCQHVLTVNELEARRLRTLGIPGVQTLGVMREIMPTSRPWETRTGMLFVGSLHATETPNYDSLCWFIDEVLPLVEAELGCETHLKIAGYVAPGVDVARFNAHPRVALLGPAANLAPLYDQTRLVIAPTRFAAGVPYKVYEAASFGVPVVATTLLREQLGWSDQVHLLSADVNDPPAFSRLIVKLHQSPDLWAMLRTGAIERLHRENTRETYVRILAGVLSDQQDNSSLQPTFV